MSATFGELFGSGATLGPSIKTPFFQSATWVAPQDGIAIIRAMGAGGSGAVGTHGPGGYAGAWGVKILRVAKGQSFAVAIGAGGAARTGTGNGNAGGATTITTLGVTRTAPGGLGGVHSTNSTPPVQPDGPALPVGDWDLGAASVKSWVNPGASGTSGGAGVDILAKGGGLTSSSGMPGGGTGGTGGTDYGGGALPSGATATGQSTPASSAGIFYDASDGEWVISFYGGSGGRGVIGGAGAPGGNGGGGSQGGGGASGAGGFGGGGGGHWSTTSAVIAGAGGIGAGGGGAGSNVSSTSGAGGQGFAVIEFHADMGV